MLYLQVLHEAFPSISREQRIRLKTVQGTVILLFDPLDPESIEGLLGLEESTVRSTLRSLHSIMTVPIAGGGPVRLIHPSYHDFLVDANRCDDVDFLVDMRLQHTLLSIACESCRRFCRTCAKLRIHRYTIERLSTFPNELQLTFRSTFNMLVGIGHLICQMEMFTRQ